MVMDEKITIIECATGKPAVRRTVNSSIIDLFVIVGTPTVIVTPIPTIPQYVMVFGNDEHLKENRRLFGLSISGTILVVKIANNFSGLTSIDNEIYPEIEFLLNTRNDIHQPITPIEFSLN